MKNKIYCSLILLFSILIFFQCSTQLEKTGALLEISPGEIRFTQDDSVKVITVLNMGNEDLSWKVQTTPDWLIYTKNNGDLTAGTKDTFSVKYENSLLDTVVEYREKIIFSSNVNSAEIDVIFQSEQPNLKVSKTSLEYGLNETSQKIAVSNSRNGFLDWKAIPTVAWISVSPDNGHTAVDTPDSMTITIDPSQLPEPGEYLGAVKITSDANGPIFFTTISKEINITLYNLGVDYSSLRDGKKLTFPILQYGGNTILVESEYYIQPIGAKKNCSWQIISGTVPSGIQFAVEKYSGSNSAKFLGSVEMSISSDLVLRLTDGLNSTIDLPVTINSRNIEIDDPEMVPVTGGSFTMGDSWGDGLSVELPLHNVTLNAFQIGRYEVTNEEFYNFVLAGGYKNKNYWLITDGSDGEEAGWDEITNKNYNQPRFWSNSDTPWDTCSASNQAASPIIGVSWYEAYAYCNWMSQITGTTYKLPTEAQWERTARGAGAGRKYPWGNDWQETYANWDDNGEKDGFVYAAPIGSYENGKSVEGCYDLAGNVWEWCYDWYADYESGTFIDPVGPASGEARVVRGGSSKSIPRSLRTVSRTKIEPNSANTNIGFRLVIWE
jgi:formylglycine-generating enzyme required for sulfatase activity